MIDTRVALCAVVLLAACGREAEDQNLPEHAAAPAAVPGVQTAVAEVAMVREVLRAAAAIAADPEAPELRDARAQLAEAEARQRLAGEQAARMTALAQGAIAPRKDLESAHAEATTAAAAVVRARQILAALGGRGDAAPLPADETWAIAQIMQRDLAAITAGAEVQVTPDAFPDRAFGGVVDAPASYVDPTTRLAPVRLRVRDPDDRLRPGMTGAVAIEIGTPHEAVVVPSGAVVYDGAQAMVFVAEGDGSYRARLVRLGVERDGMVEVIGIGAGGRVVTTGAPSLLSALRLPTAAEAD